MSSFEHRQETGQYGFDRLVTGGTLSVVDADGGGWFCLDCLADTTFTTLTESRSSTGLLDAAYPAGSRIYGLFNGTITISDGDVMCYRRPPT